MKKFTFTLMMVCLAGPFAQAQLKLLPDNKMTLGNVSLFHSYTTRLEGYGHYMSRGSNFLEFCISTLNPRIAGTGNKVVFYNSETSTFNSIEVSTVYNNSDRDAKTNIAAVENGLQTVLALKPVTFDWKDPKDGIKDGQTGKVPSNIGFISQEVEAVLPDLVLTDSVGHKVMNYIGIIPVLTRSIQELSTKVDELESGKEASEATIAALEAEVAALKERAER